MAFSVAQRTVEIGIRQAMGARRGDILRLVMVQGMRLSLLGVVLGIVCAAALTRLMEGMLFHVSPTDPLTFAAIALLFLIVSLVACLAPAWRATRIAPVNALRAG
jgi:ABC-type lipoprotein release transport system permease subunit